ncbi:MAG: alpha/beta hydrolase [Promethearchaeota archaeon]
MSEYKSENYFISNEKEKLKIQARLFIPSHLYKDKSNILAVVCHPHPQFGGTMQNSVVRSARDAILGKGICCVTFNFRGVGKSTGSYGNGIGEQEDLRIVLNFFLNSEKYDSIILIGYSFGAIVSLAIANEFEQIFALILISYPFNFIKSIKPNYEISLPKLFVTGTEDDFVPISMFRNEYTRFHPPKQLALIQNSDHFYIGYEKEIEKEIINFLETTFKIENS